MSEMQNAANLSAGADNPMVAIEQSRVVQEVQGAIVVAKKFPRDMNAALERIKLACRSIDVAKQAEYTYPRGDQQVSGPSIRLAEVVAQQWGNFISGVKEVSQADGWSEVVTFAWDLETNTRDEKSFRVAHIRQRRQGNIKLTDPRDIYEMVANQGARRKRACILAVIPRAVFDQAAEVCRETIAGAEKKRAPLPQRIGEMERVFFERHKVTKEHIEKYLGHPIGQTTEEELGKMRGIIQSLADNMASPLDYFDMAPQPETSTADKLRQREAEEGQPPDPPEESPPAEADGPPVEPKQPAQENAPPAEPEATQEATQEAPAPQEAPPATPAELDIKDPSQVPADRVPWVGMNPKGEPDKKGGHYPPTEVDKIAAWLSAVNNSKGIAVMSQRYYEWEKVIADHLTEPQMKAMRGKFYGALGGMKREGLMKNLQQDGLAL